MRTYTLSVLCVMVITMSMTYCAESTEIKITKPSEGSTISQIVDVEGASMDIPTGYELWIMVYPNVANRYYPQDKRDLQIHIMANGDWLGKAIVGGSMDTGLEFKLFVVLADESASNEIIKYLDECKLRGSWPGLEELPEGAVAYDVVSVIRG